MLICTLKRKSSGHTLPAMQICSRLVLFLCTCRQIPHSRQQQQLRAVKPATRSRRTCILGPCLHASLQRIPPRPTHDIHVLRHRRHLCALLHLPSTEVTCRPHQLQWTTEVVLERVCVVGSVAGDHFLAGTASHAWLCGGGWGHGVYFRG